MMGNQSVGQYLGRDVCVLASSALFSELAPGALAHAAVMIWLPSARLLTEFRSHVQEVVRALPLVVFVAGPRAAEAFDLLLQCLDTDDPLPQIMTKTSQGTLDECVGELLQGTWPSDDRYDDWTTYVLAAQRTEINDVRKVLAEHLGDKRLH